MSKGKKPPIYSQRQLRVGELIKQRADVRAAREKANIIREFGDKGLGLLRLKFEGLDD